MAWITDALPKLSLSSPFFLRPSPSPPPRTARPARGSHASLFSSAPFHISAVMPPKKDTDGKKRAKEIPWAKDQSLTDSLIEYFVDRPEFRRKYFSDSAEAAKKEDRIKRTGHASKMVMNLEIATALFADHAVHKDEFKQNPAHYATSTGQRISRCTASVCTFPTDSQLAA